MTDFLVIGSILRRLKLGKCNVEEVTLGKKKIALLTMAGLLV
jgi:hypothetical protein